VIWVAPDVERSEDYSERRNGPEREMRGWLGWHRATLLRKCAGLDAAQLATRSVPPSNLSLLGLVRHMSDTSAGGSGRPTGPSRYPTCTTAPLPGSGLRRGRPGGAPMAAVPRHSMYLHQPPAALTS
jgi:hypothetical protein